MILLRTSSPLVNIYKFLLSQTGELLANIEIVVRAPTGEGLGTLILGSGVSGSKGQKSLTLTARQMTIPSNYNEVFFYPKDA